MYSLSEIYGMALGFLGGILIALGLICLYGYGLMWSWNTFLVPVWHWSEITFWQGLALALLSSLWKSPPAMNFPKREQEQ